MSAITELFSGLAVSDRDASVAWYERLFGRPPDFFPNDDEAVWQLAGSGWAYVVRDPARVGKGLLTLLVDDLEAHVAELAGRDLAPGAIETIPGVVRTSEIADPDGNTIKFAEGLGAE